MRGGQRAACYIRSRGRGRESSRSRSYRTAMTTGRTVPQVIYDRSWAAEDIVLAPVEGHPAGGAVVVGLGPRTEASSAL